MSKFRTDINGLRAIAVASVVIFHFSPALLPGGFVGVDVFFVISGFLMTGIIFRGLDNNSFSILKFYASRANRIIPPLAALCFFLLIFGWIYLTPLDYQMLAKHVASSLGFISNIVYWKEAGYFDPASQEKWLLHTWSLSVEWQFYILYPLVLVALRSFLSLHAIKKIILLGTFLGFALSIVASYMWPKSAYFLLPTRAWEMMIGGIAFLYPLVLNEQRSRALQNVGLIMILASFFVLTKEYSWPGVFALLPVLGSYLFILANYSGNVLLNRPFMRIIGKSSYSIYLWHWPIVVALFYYSFDGVFVVLGILFSVLLGFLSYKYIESKNFGLANYKVTDLIKYRPIQMIFLVGFISFSVYSENGAMFRFSEVDQVRFKKALEAVNDWFYPESNLIVNGHDVRLIERGGDENILFIGASHIEHTYPYVESLSISSDVYYLTMGGCFISKSFVRKNYDCSNIQNYKGFIESIHFNKIVTSLYFIDGYLAEDEKERKVQLENRLSDFEEFLRFAKKNSEQVFVILGEPKGAEFNPVKSIRYGLDEYITVDKARKNYEIHYDILERLKKIDGLIFIDPIDHLCEELCYVKDGKGKFFYRDDTHMRPWYAKKAMTYLDEIFR